MGPVMDTTGHTDLRHAVTLSEAADTLLTHAPLKWKVAWRGRLAWLRARHQYQVPPPGDWYAWMIRAGRGTGKTRTGAEDVVDFCTDNRGVLYGIVAPTLGDGRDIAVEGESGVLSVLHRRGFEPGTDYQWNRSLLELTFHATASKARVFGSEKPDRLRGPNLHRAWCEELASWKDAGLGDELNTTWNNLTLALRKGTDPRILITTTPRRVKLIRELMDDPDVVETRGSTADNAANLAPGFLRRLVRYEGTRIGRQELHGELIEDVEGAYWSFLMIDKNRLARSPRLARVVVGVDPPGGATEAGIVAAGLIESPCPCKQEKELPHYAVLRDRSKQTSPEGWGRRAGKLYDDMEADRVIGEVNFGGDMVEAIMRQVRPDVPFTSVRASRGKGRRAEPVSAMYEQGRVHHVGKPERFADLENEMTTWTDEERWSPNRLDAVVWALTFLSTAPKKRKWAAR